MVELADGKQVAMAAVGRAGVAGGLLLTLGSDRDGHRAMIQIPGVALRIEAAAFRRALDSLPSLRAVMLRYRFARLAQRANRRAQPAGPAGSFEWG